MPPYPIILILGPTAGGKTRLAIDLARRLARPGEVLMGGSQTRDTDETLTVLIQRAREQKKTVIPGLYASPSEPLPFDTSLDIRAFLLQRKQGNLLVYSARAADVQREVGAQRTLHSHGWMCSTVKISSSVIRNSRPMSEPVSAASCASPARRMVSSG